MPARLITVPLVTLATAALVAACGGDDTSATRAPAPGGGTSSATAGPAAEQAVFGDADITFARDMVVHHEQAVEIAELAATRTDDVQVTGIAAGVASSRRPEIDQLTGLLRAWGVDPTPNPSKGGTGDMGGVDHRGHDDTTFDDADLDALGMLSGRDFDRQWLGTMISQHRDAIGVAEVQRTEGRNSDARALAERVVVAHQAGIDDMEALLPPY